MYEQQNFESASEAVSPNPARELSASLFNEQVSQFQKCDGHPPKLTEGNSETFMSDTINQQLNDNIYKKEPVENKSSQNVESTISSNREAALAGGESIAASTSVEKSLSNQEDLVSNRTVLQLGRNVADLKPLENNYSSQRDPRIGTFSGGNIDKAVEIKSAVEVSPGRLTTEEDSPKTEEQKMSEAVDWAKQNFNRIDIHKDGLLQKWELDLPQITGEASEHDLDMLKVLSDNKDKIKLAHIDDFHLKKLDRKDGITMNDLNALDKHFERETLIDKAEEDSKDIAKTLLEGEAPLFDFLDRASNGKIDGKIAKGDLERYMSDYDYLKQFGVNSGPYSQENVDAVSKMLETWDLDKYPGPGTRMRGLLDEGDIKDHLFKHRKDSKYKYITREKVVRAAGLG